MLTRSTTWKWVAILSGMVFAALLLASIAIIANYQTSIFSVSTDGATTVKIALLGISLSGLAISWDQIMFHHRCQTVSDCLLINGASE